LLHAPRYDGDGLAADLDVRLCLKIGRSAVRPRPWPPRISLQNRLWPAKARRRMAPDGRRHRVTHTPTENRKLGHPIPSGHHPKPQVAALW